MRKEWVCSLEVTWRDSHVDAWLGAVGSGHYPMFSRQVGEWLHPRELEYFSSLRADRRRASYLLGRCAAKLALSTYLRADVPKEIEVRPGVFGQPLVSYTTDCSPGLSLCHCEDLALAIAHGPEFIMGVDAEVCKPDRVDVIRSQVTPAELDAGCGLPLSFVQYMYLVWTAKEALSKALKCGLTVPFRILQTEGITPPDHTSHYVTHFTNFPLYSCWSWIVGHHLVAIAMPKGTTLGVDVRQHLQRCADAEPASEGPASAPPGHV